MKSTSNYREHDSLYIPEGRFKEVYVPVANSKILSPQLNKYLWCAKFQVTADGTVTYRTLGGTLVTESVLAASGVQPNVVTEIHSYSAGTLYILHDGIIEQGVAQP